MLKRNPEEFPEKPGVYIFRSEKKGVLYIGKALNLRKRTDAYFRGGSHVSQVDLVTESDELEFIITDTEKDALLLEFNLIKEYNPLYNIKLKDDRSFLFLELSTGHKFPGLKLSRGTPGKGVFSFGPLINASKGRELLDKLITVFGMRCCSNRKLSEGRACVYHYMGKCHAPCEKKDEFGYKEKVDMCLSFLKGRTAGTIEKLTKEMHTYSDKLEFELAQNKKEIIDFFRSIESMSYMISIADDDFDGLAYSMAGNRFAVFRFAVRGGAVRRREFESFPVLKGSDSCDMLKEFLVSRYSLCSETTEINLFSECNDLTDVSMALSEIRGRKVRVRVPERGRKKRIAELAELNLRIRIRQDFYEPIADGIKGALELVSTPVKIEAIDISHFSEKNRVGALVHFKDGLPVKKNYRNYRIKSTGGGDPGAIAEVLKRRAGSEDELPDLFIIDGGAPQLGAALSIKKELGFDSDIVALAKREEEIYTEKGEIVCFPKDSHELFLFQNIRDEVHRRAVTYHRKLREKL